MGLIAVDPAELATIVTTLEMTLRPPLRLLPASSLRLVRWQRPDPDKYRTLFRRVGGPWLWYSRLAMVDATLTAIVHDPGVQVHAVIDRAGVEIGLLELDLRHAGACELAYVGLVPPQPGQPNPYGQQPPQNPYGQQPPPPQGQQPGQWVAQTPSRPTVAPRSIPVVTLDALPGREIAEKLLGRGVLVKDTHGQTIRIAPPLVVRGTELDWAVEQLRYVLAD